MPLANPASPECCEYDWHPRSVHNLGMGVQRQMLYTGRPAYLDEVERAGRERGEAEVFHGPLCQELELGELSGGKLQG